MARWSKKYLSARSPSSLGITVYREVENEFVCWKIQLPKRTDFEIIRPNDVTFSLNHCQRISKKQIMRSKRFGLNFKRILITLFRFKLFTKLLSYKNEVETVVIIDGSN